MTDEESSKPLTLPRLSKLCKGLKTKVESLRKSNQRLEKSVIEHKEEVSKLKNKVQALQKEKRSFKYQINKLTTQLTQTDNDLTDSRIKLLLLQNDQMDFECIYSVITKCNYLLQQDIDRISFQLKNKFVYIIFVCLHYRTGHKY